MPILLEIRQADTQAKEELTGLCLETTQFEWVSASKKCNDGVLHA